MFFLRLPVIVKLVLSLQATLICKLVAATMRNLVEFKKIVYQPNQYSEAEKVQIS